jgi:hypothetical protein
MSYKYIWRHHFSNVPRIQKRVTWLLWPVIPFTEAQQSADPYWLNARAKIRYYSFLYVIKMVFWATIYSSYHTSILSPT